MISFYLLFARGYWVGMPVGKRAGVSGLLATGAGMPGITELNLFLNLIRAGNSLQETQLSVNLFKGLWRCKMLYANLSPPLLFYSSVKNRRANTCVRTCVCVGFKRVATPCCTSHKFYWGNSKRNLSSMALTHVDSKEGQLHARSWEFVGAHGPFSSALKHPPWPFVRLCNVFALSIMKREIYTRHKSP